MSKKGLFVVIEGPDGGGKTTQMGLLYEALVKKGLEVVRVREPGGTPLGERLRTILKQGNDLQFNEMAELFLFMSARAELVESVIIPAMKKGKIVLCDRFLFSSVVYQGYAGSLGVETVKIIGTIAVQGLSPDLTILLDISPVETTKRGIESSDRFESRGKTYLTSVRNGFLYFAEKNKDRENIVIIDACQSIDEIHLRILKEVKKLING